MHDVLLKLHQVLEEGAQAVKQHKAKLSILEDREALVTQREANVKQLQADLEAREAAIVPTETLRAGQKQLAIDQQKLSEDRAALEETKRAFETHRGATQQQLDNQRIMNDKISDELDRRQKNMEAELNLKVQEALKNFKK